MLTSIVVSLRLHAFEWDAARACIHAHIHTHTNARTLYKHKTYIVWYIRANTPHSELRTAAEKYVFVQFSCRVYFASFCFTVAVWWYVHAIRWMLNGSNWTSICVSASFCVVISMISHRQWYNKWRPGVVRVYVRAYQTFNILLHQTISYFSLLLLFLCISFHFFSINFFSSFHHSTGFIPEIRNQCCCNGRLSWTCFVHLCSAYFFIFQFFFVGYQLGKQTDTLKLPKMFKMGPIHCSILSVLLLVDCFESCRSSSSSIKLKIAHCQVVQNFSKYWKIPRKNIIKLVCF